MRLTLFVVLLSSTAIATAQRWAQSSIPAFVPPSNLVFRSIGNLACPVGMRAERQASGQREWIVALNDTLHSRRPDTRTNNAGVHVELIGVKKGMKQAQISVDYVEPGVRLLLTTQYRDTPASAFDLTKTFVLSAANGGSLELAEGLLVGNASIITRVRLLSIEYSDGSTWHTKSGSDCSVEPGLLMAVAAR